MPSVLKRGLPLAAVALASVWLASTVSSAGDWPVDSWPAVSALAHGHLSVYLSAKSMMGPFSTLVEAPFVLLSGSSGLAVYRWAAIPDLLAAGLLGLYLAGIARRRGAGALAQALLAGLTLVNPLTIEALQAGHPEEILTAALAVGAIASAAEGKGTRTAVLLGLAVASKQWAVIAILPALMALPGRRVKVGLGAAAIVVALTLPGVVASLGSFSEVNGNAASAGRVVGPWSVWYPAATVTTEKLHVDGATLVAHVHESPPPVGSLSHPLIVLLAFLLPLGLALRRRRLDLGGADAMALFALLILLRCLLDPLDNLYYHEPLLLALIGWDAFAVRGLPLRALAATAIALFFRHWSLNLTDVAAFNYAYLAVLVPVGVAIAWELWSVKTDFSLDEGQISTIKGSAGLSITPS